MNKQHLIGASKAIVVALGVVFISSCSKNTDVYDPSFEHTQVENKYKAEFVQAYGEVSPLETWDFSYRGAALTPGATRAKISSQYLSDWRGTESYGYVWNYPEKAGISDPMPENQVNDLIHNHWTQIENAINNTAAIDWNPSGSYTFRALKTTRNNSTASKYFAVGAEIDDIDLYLRLSSPANGKDNKGGTTADQHTSSINFGEVPSSAVWYACSTTGNNKNKIAIDANNYKLTKFKEVTVSINNKEYTFWCFKCDAQNGTYADLVLWVQKIIPATPTLGEAKRYMVEDLGNASATDFDFNDVVFDVIEINNVDGKKTYKCFVRALGGTKDITIKVGNSTWKKSTKFDATKMYNTQYDIDYALALDEFDVEGWIPGTNNVQVFVEDKPDFVYGLPFPKPGEVPFIVSVIDGKNWKVERQPVEDLHWFVEPNEE